jgi:hypothetical protein
MKIDYKKAFSALYSASKLGIFITEADGHYWINCCDVDQFNFNKVLHEFGVLVNNKIYEGPLQALSVINKALKLCGYEEGLDVNLDEFGSPKLDESRIDIVEKGKGGLC